MKITCSQCHHWHGKTSYCRKETCHKNGLPQERPGRAMACEQDFLPRGLGSLDAAMRFLLRKRKACSQA